LYFLGHMAWAYVWAVIAWALIPAAKRGGKLFVPAILMLGVLPDVDLLLGGLGVVHRTVTHSFFLWTVLFIPVFVILRFKAIPYFVAVVQHFAFGDFLMGKVMLFWPFSSKLVGLGFGMPSVVDVVLETAGLLFALIILLYIGDLKQLFSVNKRNVFMLLPLLALLTSAVFFLSHWSSIVSLAGYIVSSGLLVTLMLAHVILFVLIAISTVQGLRAFRRRAK